MSAVRAGRAERERRRKESAKRIRRFRRQAEVVGVRCSCGFTVAPGVRDPALAAREHKLAAIERGEGDGHRVVLGGLS